MSELKATDIEVYNAIQNEEQRELEKILLIASENCVSRAVLEAQCSVFTNKYAEGYPNKRYYGGCEFADAVETLAIERAKQLFGCEHVNVQPHSGSSANMAVYFSVLQPGDTILGMALPHGGHLTHGASVKPTPVRAAPPTPGKAIRRLLWRKECSRSSVAKGDMTRDTDIDLLVLKAAPGNPRKESVLLRQALGGLGYPFEIIVMATERFDESKGVIGGIAFPANKYGKVIYEAA